MTRFDPWQNRPERPVRRQRAFSRPRALLVWLAVFAVVVAGRPEGDFALAQDLRGLLLMAAGVGLVVVAVVGLTGGRGSST